MTFYNTYRVTASTPFRVKTASWLLHVHCSPANKSIPEALAIVDDLINGGSIELVLSDNEVALAEDICTFTDVTHEDPFEKQVMTQAEYLELRYRGAEGDTEAAIAYCKLDAQGLVNHNPFG